MYKYFETITKQEKERTKILLFGTRNKFGIDTYLLLKKLLLIAIIIHYYQTKTNKISWVSYQIILKRYEYKYTHQNKQEFNDFGRTFFGINKEDVYIRNIIELENFIIKKYFNNTHIT